MITKMYHNMVTDGGLTLGGGNTIQMMCYRILYFKPVYFY